MRSKFIQDVEKFSTDMVERLPETKEGGIIILAVDDSKDGDVLVSVIANKIHKRQLVKLFLLKEDLQQDIIDVLDEDEFNSERKEQ